MPLTPIKLPPGVVTGLSDYDARGRWIRSNRVRFQGSEPEKIGGCAKATQTALTGICRGIHGWGDGDGNKRVVFGTHKKLQTFYAGVLYDLTPVVSSGTLGANPFITAGSGSLIVNVTHTAHGRAATDYILLTNTATVGGIVPTGEYAITSIVDANNYTLTHTATATASATGGGTAVTFQYLLGNGLADDGEAGGFGAGGFGLGPFGVGLAGGLPVNARTWALDNYGENLIATPRGGGIYQWAPPVGTPSTRASAVSGAPTACNGSFVTEERMIFAYGVTTVAAGSGFTGSKMFCQWCDEVDNTNWIPATANTANGRTLQGGNELLGHIKITRGLYLLLSDTSAFRVQHSQDDYVYSTLKIGDAAGIIGPKAGAALAMRGYWMGRDNLWMSDGGLPQPMPNVADIWSYIFRNINLSQKNKCHAAINEKFGEVWFFWCSSNASEIDRYAIYNQDNQRWVYGAWARTAWLRRDIFDNPHATDATSYIYYHESGVDDDGAAMGDLIESAPGDIAEGAASVIVDQIVPDLKDLIGSAEFTVLTADAPAGTVTDNGPYNVTTMTTTIDPDPRIDGRQVGMRIESVSTGSHWRMGRPRVNLMPTGKRPPS